MSGSCWKSMREEGWLSLQTLLALSIKGRPWPIEFFSSAYPQEAICWGSCPWLLQWWLEFLHMLLWALRLFASLTAGISKCLMGRAPWASVRVGTWGLSVPPSSCCKYLLQEWSAAGRERRSPWSVWGRPFCFVLGVQNRVRKQDQGKGLCLEGLMKAAVFTYSSGLVGHQGAAGCTVRCLLFLGHLVPPCQIKELRKIPDISLAPSHLKGLTRPMIFLWLIPRFP